MNLKLVKRAVLASLGDDWEVIDTPWDYQVRFSGHGGAVCGIGELLTLSKILGTEKISLDYTSESGGWSDWTPGEASSFVIRVDKKGIEKK